MGSAFRQYIKGFTPKRNIYIATAWNFFVVMLFFTICRYLFFIFNRDLFPNTTSDVLTRIFLGGLKFDVAGALYVNLLYILMLILPFRFRYNKVYLNVSKYIFVITNSIALASNCIDIIYFRFTMRRTTASVFNEFENESNFGSLIPQFITDYWYILLIWIALVTGLILLYGKIEKPKLYNNIKFRIVYFINGLLVLAIISTLMVGGIRGGFKHSTRPITLSNAGAYVNEPLENAIVLNTPFAIIRTINKEPLPEIKYFESTNELEQNFNPLQQVSLADSSMRKLNVVIFILESFGREYISAYNTHSTDRAYTGYAPFMDSLMQNSLFFRYAYGNGRKSIDGMPSVLASIPMMVEPYFLTSYSSNKINSIASLLKAEGYHTAFFHGAPNGSMGFDAFANIAGFDSYYGLNEYGNDKDFDGMWAIWDEEFFQFFANKMGEFKEPFCATLFSASSHHPFKVPARYDGVFPMGVLPMHQCIGYTDHAIKRFFETASKQPWFSNTLFVLTADHPNQSFYPEYKTSAGSFAVPIIFHRPNGSFKGECNGLAQQIDIMPSVLGLLGYNKPFVAFGRNLFDNEQVPFVINYFNGNYQLFMGDYLYIYDGTTSIALYNFKNDIMLTKNILVDNAEIEESMCNKLKAIIQQYNNRMRSNKLTAGN